MQCSRCKDYRPDSKCDYKVFVCLACGQSWRRWKTGNTEAWYNNGIFDLKHMEEIPEALNDKEEERL